MRSPLKRMRRGAIALGIVFLVSVCGYRYSGEYTWPEAVWMVVITLSSVGYGEKSTLPPYLQLYTAAVIIFGITAVAYTLGGFGQLVLEGELDHLLGHRRMTREINQLHQHTILCGFGRTGKILAKELVRCELPFVIIEQNAELVTEARERDYLCLHADATDDETLITAGVHKAKSLLTALPNDAANVFITLSARNLNRDLLIVARAEHAATERKLRQAGADRVVMPTTIGAQQMSRIVTRPTTADLMELMADSGNLNIELDEFSLRSEGPLTGVKIRDTEAGAKFGLLLVAVKQATQGMIFNPPADYEFQAADTVILMGPAENIDRFRKEYQL